VKRKVPRGYAWMGRLLFEFSRCTQSKETFVVACDF
jgi:hypothetical protein